MSQRYAGSPEVRAELGAKRCFWSKRIYEALGRKGMTATTLAYAIGLSKKSVGATILGRNHSPRVLDALRAAGVPEEYLFDPRRVEDVIKEA